MFKIIITLILLSLSVYACPPFKDPIPIADVHVEIDAKKTKTSFKIIWEFKTDLLANHDKNKNGIFDKDEQEDIKNEYINHIKSVNYMTDIVYVKKGQRVKKSLAKKIIVNDFKLTFSDKVIKLYYTFNTNFTLKQNHKLFIRFLDPVQKVHVSLSDIIIKNYKGTKSIVTQDIRANIYFYKHKKKYKSLKNIILVK